MVKGVYSCRVIVLVLQKIAITSLQQSMNMEAKKPAYLNSTQLRRVRKRRNQAGKDLEKVIMR